MTHERNDYELDNRDTGTTWIWLDKDLLEQPIEVNPWDLVINALENSPLTETRQKEYIDRVQQILTDLDKETL
jgi:hypothetical protein